MNDTEKMLFDSFMKEIWPNPLANVLAAYRGYHEARYEKLKEIDLGIANDAKVLAGIAKKYELKATIALKS